MRALDEAMAIAAARWGYESPRHRLWHRANHVPVLCPLCGRDDGWVWDGAAAAYRCEHGDRQAIIRPERVGLVRVVTGGGD